VYALLKIGDVLLKMGKADDASEYYRSAEALAASSVAKDPDNESDRANLRGAYYRIGEVEDFRASHASPSKQPQYRKQACVFYRKAYEQWRSATGVPTTPDAKKTFDDLTEKVARCAKSSL
jgi:hypothetical protein